MTQYRLIGYWDGVDTVDFSDHGSPILTDRPPSREEMIAVATGRGCWPSPNRGAKAGVCDPVYYRIEPPPPPVGNMPPPRPIPLAVDTAATAQTPTIRRDSAAADERGGYIGLRRDQ